MSTKTTQFRIKKWRKASGLTLEQAAAKLGATTSTVWLWEQGLRKPIGLYRQAVERELSQWEKQAQAAEK